LLRTSTRSVGQSSSIDCHPINITTVTRQISADIEPQHWATHMRGRGTHVLRGFNQLED
jgi:hypothetical protein